jgi:hypothetical protein
MSEYQYLTFRAIDGPLSEEALQFMRRQSTRAEIDEWSFTNEYNFGNFGGDAIEMMRRGYDMHLHYANFGYRTLMIRLPAGFPDMKAAEEYIDEDGLTWHKDKKGPGGVLEIDPYYDSDEREDLWNLEDIFKDLFPIRSELIEGDLRPLYLAHLAVSRDSNHDPEEIQEAPVPAGLGSLTQAQMALAKLYGIDKHLIAAAAELAPAAPAGQDRGAMYAQWLRQQSEADKNAWLEELMSNPESRIRLKLLTQFREEQPGVGWPTAPSTRTIAELEEAAKPIREGARVKAKADATRKRAKYLRDIAADPASTLKKTEELVSLRSTENYGQAAQLLADLREALADSGGPEIAEKQAQKLRKANPTLRLLVSALRKKGFLPK